MSKIVAIASIGVNNQIGLGNELVHSSKRDTKLFKEITINNIVIMGFNTFVDIGSPLSNRINIVITSKKEYDVTDEKDLYYVRSIEEAINLAKSLAEDKDIFVIGGGSIYRQTLNFCDSLLIYHNEYDGEAEVFFPDLRATAFKELVDIDDENKYVKYKKHFKIYLNTEIPENKRLFEIQTERKELIIKITNLDKFLNSLKSIKTVLSEKHIDLLKQQKEAMKKYCDILSLRIKDIEESK